MTKNQFEFFQMLISVQQHIVHAHAGNRPQLVRLLLLRQTGKLPLRLTKAV